MRRRPRPASRTRRWSWSACGPVRSTAARYASTCTTRGAKKGGETDERLSTLSAWRDAPYFTDAERAALALAEAGTRLADRSEPVPGDVFDEAAKYYDEAALAALVVSIAAINTWNRLNVITGQVAGDWTAQYVS